MLFQVVIDNGTKKIVPLTADAGAGNPVGTIIPMYKKSSPSGYLYCDGSTFDETIYPALYQYLGSNVLPDYREFALVGAEQNTTSSNIANHDIYTEGQEKDDQLQDLEFNMSPEGPASNSLVYGSDALGFSKLSTIGRSGNRVGSVTRGKRKAVYFYIKATSGLTENQQENVLNTINENNSYSTEEHPTGKKWIDGKPIYRKVYNITTPDTADTNMSVASLPNNLGEIVYAYFEINAREIEDLSSVYPAPSPKMTGDTDEYLCYWASYSSSTIRCRVGTKFVSLPLVGILEYTKTTEN